MLFDGVLVAVADVVLAKVTVIPRLKLMIIRVIFPNFQNCACFEKHWTDNKHPPFGTKLCSDINFVSRHTFGEANSFTRGRFEENCYC